MKGKFCHNKVFRPVCVCETRVVWLRWWLTPEVAYTPGFALITFEFEGQYANQCALASGEFCILILFGLAARGWGLAWVVVARRGRASLQPSWHVLQPVRGPISGCLGPVLSCSLPQAWEYLYKTTYNTYIYNYIYVCVWLCVYVYTQIRML